MNNRKTSISTYNEIKNNGHLSAKRFQVYDIFYEFGNLTGSEVSNIYKSRFPSSKTSETIRNRITELVKMKVCEELGTTEDPNSGRTVMLFGITDNMPVKLELPKTMNQKKNDIMESVTAFGKKHIGDLSLESNQQMRTDLGIIYNMVKELTKKK